MATTRKTPASTARAKPAVKAAKGKAPERTFTQTEVATLVKSIVNRYDAAGMGRRMRGWNPPNSGPNKAMVGLENVRKRSRDSVRNDWSGRAGIQRWVTNLIGVGITPRLKRVKSKTKKQEYNDLWDDWCKIADADSVLTFYGLQTLATRAWLESGEVFVRMRPRRLESGLIVPFQIQVIEADFVPMLDADTWPDLPTGHRIRSGIELNRTGQRVAYWVFKEHPGDNTGISTIDRSKLVRVAKSQMLHIFEPTRPGQLRGVPDFAPVLARVRNVLDFDDAVLERQKLANLFAAFIKKPALTQMDDGVDPVTGQAIETNAEGQQIAALEPGLMQELLPGEDIAFANPPEAGTTYSEFMRSQNLGTAAGQGLPYEVMSGDIKEISDRTLRVIINEFRRFAEQRQWQIIVPMLCQPVREYWVDQAILAGTVAAADIDDLKRVEWAPQGWAYIHPVQDVQAKVVEVQNRLRSRSSVIAERGDDPEVVDQEIADDHEREEELGIAPMDPAQQQQQPGEGDPQQQGDGDGIAPGEYPRNVALQNLQASVGRLEALVASVQAFQQGNAQKTEAPSITVHAHLPAPAVTVTNEVPAPEVKVEVSNNVEVPEVKVEVTNDVKPTPVNVEAPVVTVEAPVVNVTNEVQPAEVSVNLPDRKTESSIKRDQQGNIISVTQTEKTIQ